MFKTIIVRIVSVASILALSLFLFDCKSKNPPLRVALLEWPPYELAFWARENGWITEEHATLLEYKTPAEVTRAFATESIDIIAVTSDFALTVSELVPDTRIFLVIDSSNGGDALLSRSPINSAQELKGKRLGVEYGPLGTYMLMRFLEQFELTINDIDIVYEDIPGQLDRWQRGDIDLLITYEPIRTKLISAGAHEIFSTAEIPNEIIDVFLIRESVLHKQSENIDAFIRAWFKAVDELHANSPALYQFIGRRESLSSAAVQDIFELIKVPSLEENRTLLSVESLEMIEALHRHEKIMLEQGLMTRSINKKRLITDTALPLQGE